MTSAEGRQEGAAAHSWGEPSFTRPANSDPVNVGANTQEQVSTRAFPEVLFFGRAYLQLSSDVSLDKLSV